MKSPRMTTVKTEETIWGFRCKVNHICIGDTTTTLKYKFHKEINYYYERNGHILGRLYPIGFVEEENFKKQKFKSE